MAQGYSVRDLLWNRIQIYYSTDLQCIVQWHRSTIAQCYYGTMLLDLPGRDLLSQRTTMAEIYYGTLLLWHRAPAQILISLVLAEYTCTVHNPILHHCHFDIFKHTTRSFRIYPDILTTDYEPRASFDVQDNL